MVRALGAVVRRTRIMARYIGPVCRLCRREGMKLFLKGDRCFTEKCAIEKRNYAPGQHGKGGRKASCRATACSSARSRRSSASTACWRTSSPLLRPRRPPRRASWARCCCSKLERRLDNVDLPARLRHLARPGAAARAARPRAGQRQEGRHPVLPGEGGRRREPAAPSEPRTRRSCTPVEAVKGRGVPKWLELDAAA